MTDRPVGKGPVPRSEIIADETEGLTIVSRSFGRQTWDRFKHHKIAIIAAVLLTALTISFWVGPMLSPWEFDDVNIAELAQGPSLRHPFGTDDIGRDLMVRTFKGGQFSIRIALMVAILTTAIGALIGAIAGYFGGVVDILLGQLINLFLIVPAFIILLVIAVKWGSSANVIAILLALLLWPQIARIVRGLVMQYKEQEFVLAARAAGARPGRILFRHILPNTFGPIIVNATLLVGVAIILESTLSFLALGVRPPTPTLGNLIAEAKGLIDNEPLRILIPGGFVVLITLCINFLGDGLRDALDPTSRTSRK
jgi:ABC-type dipeptide/oligopeptide/nickel transport system permease subunit